MERRRLAPFATDDPRAEQARELRRQGLTIRQIAARLQPVSRESVTAWCRGVPSPHDRWRYAARDALREECRRLRLEEQLSYSEIAARTGAASGSLSLWLRDLPVPQRCRRPDSAAASRRSRRYWDRELARRDAERRRVTDAACREVRPLSDRELLLVGTALYWAEGSKWKPWRPNERVVFVNSDPGMVRVFMRWLALLGRGPGDCSFRVQIHETADVEAAEAFWATVVGADVGRFGRATVKRHHPLTNRRNREAGSYHGCLTVSVRRGAALYQQIDGWWKGITLAVTNGAAASG